MEHDWDVTPRQAVEIQRTLRQQLKVRRMPLSGISKIAGADVSFNRHEKDVYAGVIVLSYPDLEVLEYSCVKMQINFPYIPGLLSFRELPPLLSAFRNLSNKPDIVMVDGQGIAHPRRLGIAAHFGLTADIPTIGVAKSRLFGDFEEPDAEEGGMTPLFDPDTNKGLGVVIRTKRRAKPVIVSPGHLMTVDDAARIVFHTLRGYRLPEPTRRAHLLVNQWRKGEIKASWKNKNAIKR